MLQGCGNISNFVKLETLQRCSKSKFCLSTTVPRQGRGTTTETLDSRLEDRAELHEETRNLIGRYFLDAIGQ